jgi:ankyrin repeat protein
MDKHGRSALHYAIDFGNEQLVELFLSNEKCDPNLLDRDQMTPLHLAIKRNNPRIVQSLLSDQHEQQADPNIINRYGQTPLHLAASVGYIDIVRLLLLSNLREPCDPTILDSQQLTAHELAKANHQEACAKLIEEYQQKRYKPSLQRQTTISINEQLSMKATSSISLTPAANLQHDRDETSDNSSSLSTAKPSKSLPKRKSDQWSDDIDPSTSESKPGIHSLFKTNPLQSNQTQKNTSSTLNHLFNNNPLEPKSKKTTSTCKASSRNFRC